ncbi:MAG: hypothetical protein FJ149_08930 [Euryarchaeota archaeon]|nr:hypothetical protein [Euryarchaeota archaeon]
MTEERRPWAPAATLAVLAMLLLPGPAGGAGPRTVSQFSDGSSEATFYFGTGPRTLSTNITLPREAAIASAGVVVEGLPGRDGEFPLGPELRLGDGGGRLWDFGANAPGAGEMGRQRAFSDGRTELSFSFPGAGGGSSRGSVVLPASAQVEEASVQIGGGVGPLAPVVHAPAREVPRVFWNGRDGTVVQAAVTDDGVDFSGRDPVSGAVLRSRRLALGPSAGRSVADIQYLPGSDRAAVLIPGKGVVVFELATGGEQQFFTGGEAAALKAMSFSETYLAVLGRDFAGVKSLVGGAVDIVNSTEFPDAGWYDPVAVDYDPGGRRLVMAGRGSPFPAKTVSVFDLDGRRYRVLTDLSVTSNLASMLFLPESNTVLLRLSGTGSVNGYSNNHAAVSLSLEDGKVSYIEPLEQLRSVTALRRSENTVCAIGDPPYRDYHGPRLVLIDVGEGSWRVFSGSGTAWASARYWAYDPARQRLLLASEGAGLDVFELDFALMAGRSWRLPDEGSPVPADVRSALPDGGGLLAGTRSGVVAFDAGGKRNWSVHCGEVDGLAADPVSGGVVVAARGGLECLPGVEAWFPGTLEILRLDLSVAPPAVRRQEVDLLPEHYVIHIDAIQPCPPNGSVFLAVTAYYGSGLYELWPDGTFARVETPSLAVHSLALSPDGGTLYVSSHSTGLLVLDIASGRQELLTPFSETPLLSPVITSISVDATGGVLLCQAPASGYFPGGVSLLVPAPNGSLRLALSQRFGDTYLDAAARDPEGRRIFVTDGRTLSVIDEVDGSRADLSPGPYMSSLAWSPESGALVGAGQGRAFRLEWGTGPPREVGLDIGGDGTVEWTGAGPLGGRVRVDIAAALNGLLASGVGGARFAEIPIKVTCGSGGVVRLDSLSITYAFSERVDLKDALAERLRAIPPTGEATFRLSVSATGGGLKLSGLDVEFWTGEPPRAQRLPVLRVDTAARSPTFLDLTRYFTDDTTPPGNLTFGLDVQGRPSGVSVSLAFGRYAVIDARNASFRGGVRVTVTATDSQGLQGSSEMRLTVFRSGEYVPPPPYYGALAWAFGAAVLVLGLLAIRLYIRSARKRG